MRSKRLESWWKCRVQEFVINYKQPYYKNSLPMNLLLLASKNSNHINYLKYLNTSHTLYTLDDEAEVFPDQINALIARPWTHIQQEILEQYSNLQYLFVTWAGTNHIDKEYCVAHSIQIINRPWSNARGVADLAVRGILSHCRDAYIAYQDTKQWTLKPRQEYCGRSLCELNYWFVWCGMISLTIWETLQWFGVTHWHYHDPYLSGEQAGILPSTLSEVSTSDCLIIWAPHTPQTHEMINQSVFKTLPDHAIVINVARGGLVHEVDLLQFLTSRPDCKYYTDVRQWEPEMTEILRQLIALPNYIVTPHIAAETHESQTKMHYFEQLA